MTPKNNDRTTSRSRYMLTPSLHLIVGLVLLGSYTINVYANNDITTVQERAQARWQAIVAGELDTAYTFANPGFRSTITPEFHHHRLVSGIEWQAAEIHQVECQTQRCTVSVNVTYEVTEPPTGIAFDETLEEIWIFVNDQWWIYLRT